MKLGSCTCSSPYASHNEAYGGVGHSFDLGYKTWSYTVPWCQSSGDYYFFTRKYYSLMDYDDGVNQARRAQITSAANNPLGTGRGIRVWADEVGLGGGNSGIGGLEFPQGVKEFWMRWYVRYAEGFRWYPDLVYLKLNRFRWQMTASPGDERQMIVGLIGPDSCAWYQDLHTEEGGTIKQEASQCGWNTMMGGIEKCTKDPTNPGYCLADGKFHEVQVHLKINTIGQPDGLAEYWLDGVKKLTMLNINWKTGYQWARTAAGNQATVNNTPTTGLWGQYVDYDDVAISTTGYIPSLGQGPVDDLAPAAPSGVRVN